MNSSYKTKSESAKLLRDLIIKQDEAIERALLAVQKAFLGEVMACKSESDKKDEELLFQKSNVIKFCVECFEANGHIIYPDFAIKDVEIAVNYRYDLQAHVIDFLKKVYKTTDSNRFETKTKTKTENKEELIGTIPATLWDHVKHIFRNWLPKSVGIYYIDIVHNTYITNNITNHNTILEYTCPHLNLSSNHENHILHLYQGVTPSDRKC